MFKVDTNEQFFNEFKRLQDKIQQLSSIFQNPNTEITAEEFGDWNMLSKEIKQDLNKLIKDGTSRIKMS